MIMYSAIHKVNPSFILEMKFDDGTIKRQFITIGTRLKISYYKGYEIITKSGIVKGIGEPIRINDDYDRHGQIQALRNDKFGEIGPNYVYMTGIPSPHNNSLMHLDPHNMPIRANPLRVPPQEYSGAKYKNDEGKKPMPPYHAHMNGECVYIHDHIKNYEMTPHESVMDIPEENIFVVLCMDFSKDYSSDIDHIPTTNIRDIELIVPDEKMELFNYYNNIVKLENIEDSLWTKESYMIFDKMRNLIKYILDNPEECTSIEEANSALALINNAVMGLIPIENSTEDPDDSNESTDPIIPEEPPKDIDDGNHNNENGEEVINNG